MATQRIQLPAWRKRFMGRRGDVSAGGDVSAYRRIGVSAYRRVGVSARRRVGGFGACKRVGVATEVKTSILHEYIPL
jgi:hypothetical protein